MFDESRLSEKELAMERFVAHGGDTIVKKSQCADCLENISANECNKFKHKPEDYLFASRDIKCPERKIK